MRDGRATAQAWKVPEMADMESIATATRTSSKEYEGQDLHQRVSSLSSTPSASKRVFRVALPDTSLLRLRVNLLRNVLFILFLFLVDVQDLLYKCWYIGPMETFSFYTLVSGVLSDKSLVPRSSPVRARASENGTWLADDNLVSSWPVYLTMCRSMQPFQIEGFFVIALGLDCNVGRGDLQRHVAHLIMASSIRMDSVVWASCKVLYPSRRPTICNHKIVTDFIQRYHFSDSPLQISELALPNSAEEEELLYFLPTSCCVRRSRKYENSASASGTCLAHCRYGSVRWNQIWRAAEQSQPLRGRLSGWLPCQWHWLLCEESNKRQLFRLWATVFLDGFVRLDGHRHQCALVLASASVHCPAVPPGVDSASSIPAPETPHTSSAHS